MFPPAITLDLKPGLGLKGNIFGFGRLGLQAQNFGYAVCGLGLANCMDPRPRSLLPWVQGRALATGRFLWPQREHGTLCRFPCEQFHLT